MTFTECVVTNPRIDLGGKCCYFGRVQYLMVITKSDTGYNKCKTKVTSLSKILKLHQLTKLKLQTFYVYCFIESENTTCLHAVQSYNTICVRDFNTIVRSCNTSITTFNHHVCAYNGKKTPRTPEKNFWNVWWFEWCMTCLCTVDECKAIPS